MKPLRTSWLLGKWCAGCLRDILLVCLWGSLTGLLLLQTGIATSSRFPMPAWVLRKIEARLEANGLRVHIQSATFDPSGRINLQNIQLTPPAYDSPILTVHRISTRLRLLPLMAGLIEPRVVQVNGLNFMLPAMFSNSGQPEAVLSDINLILKPTRKTLRLDQCSGRINHVLFQLAGCPEIPLDLFSTSDARKNPLFADGTLSRRYIAIARRLSRITRELEIFEKPFLSVNLFQSGDAISARLQATSHRMEADLSKYRAGTGRLLAEDVALTTTLPLGAGLPDSLPLHLDCARLETTTGLRARDASLVLALRLPGRDISLGIDSLSVSAGSIADTRLTVHHPLARIDYINTGGLAADLAAEMFGSKWEADAIIDPDEMSGLLNVNGAISRDMIRSLATRFGLDPDRLLETREEMPINARARFDRGFKLSQASGRFSSGYVVGYTVPFNTARATFAYDGNELTFSDMHAIQGDNEARGVYRMNVHTLEFQFLLKGRIRPLDISGYFADWWRRFWNNFDFSPSPVTADVSVSGRWGHPNETTVFVTADAPRAGINGVHFDRVRTSMFVRPDFYHALEAGLYRNGHAVRGTFTRTVDLKREEDSLRYIDFDLQSNFDIQEIARLFGQEGTQTVEPFHFDAPPDLRLSGHVDGAASGRGTHRSIRMDLKSKGAFSLYDFPLQDLSFQGTIVDDEINLAGIEVSFASGRASGNARIFGPDTDRRLHFDATLKDAVLGEAISTLETYAARARGELPPAQSRFQQQIAQGRLNLDLAAQGLYSDPFSFFGHGHLELTGAQLAQLNLLGSLSQLLSKSPLFRFTAPQLREARCSFVLEKDKLTFPNLKISGTNAMIDASGTYLLDKKSMDFNARLYPFGQGRNALASAAGFLLVPITNALELKLSGAIDQPDWRFTYGPTSFLYNLTGTKPDIQNIDSPNNEDPQRKLHQPYFKR